MPLLARTTSEPPKSALARRGSLRARVNVGFAKLQMQSDLKLSDTVYGLGAGIFFIGYFIFEVPSNIILHRAGARRWIARIMISWGVLASAMMFVGSPNDVFVPTTATVGPWDPNLQHGSPPAALLARAMLAGPWELEKQPGTETHAVSRAEISGSLRQPPGIAVGVPRGSRKWAGG
jgi:hypothetical protein